MLDETPQVVAMQTGPRGVVYQDQVAIASFASQALQRVDDRELAPRSTDAAADARVARLRQSPEASVAGGQCDDDAVD
jgi:hypothetical protein